MYLSYPTFVYGFHGCDKAVADKVINLTEPLKQSRNGYDWLGTGIYFWENDPQRALEFANEQKAFGKYSEPCVIGAIIELKNCLNLLDRRCIDLLMSSYEDFKRNVTKFQGKLPTNRSRKKTDFIKLARYLDSSVIENLHKLLQGIEYFDTVRGAFLEGDPAYKGAGFLQRNHLQICVRNQDCIKGLFFPRLRDPMTPIT